MKRVALGVFLAILLASAVGGGLLLLPVAKPPPVGGRRVEGHDEYGHEHYFVHKDGSFHWWDRDRSTTGTTRAGGRSGGCTGAPTGRLSP